ncbi:hypothetical protein [Rhodoferax ferrireducens]|uniref:hypothetical protein n=1 Tax=Rhodoferax ferrireducens TaxID=192843 RepID=UPI000E0D3F10|nr:hypothetical protein [Rhodoferax ferrireducens]
MSKDLNRKLCEMLQVGRNVTEFTLHCQVDQPPRLDVTRWLTDSNDIRELTTRFELHELPGGLHFDLDLLVRVAQRRVKDSIDRSAAHHLLEMAFPEFTKHKYPRIGDPE